LFGFERTDSLIEVAHYQTQSPKDQGFQEKLERTRSLVTILVTFTTFYLEKKRNYPGKSVQKSNEENKFWVVWKAVFVSCIEIKLHTRVELMT
jgi:uridine phosphorylase